LFYLPYLYREAALRWRCVLRGCWAAALVARLNYLHCHPIPYHQVTSRNRRAAKPKATVCVLHALAFNPCQKTKDKPAVSGRAVRGEQACVVHRTGGLRNSMTSEVLPTLQVGKAERYW